MAGLALTRIGTVGLTAAALSLPLILWWSLYPRTDWAVLALAPLTVLLLLASYSTAAKLHVARMAAVFEGSSPLARFMGGHLRAALGALFLTVLTVPVLAWQALTASAAEAGVLVAVFCVAGGLSLHAASRLRAHLRPPFSRACGVAIGTWLTALVFLPVLVWLNWSVVSRPGEFGALSLPEAVQRDLLELPGRRGWIAEILSPFYAFDAAKLWLVVRFSDLRWPGLLFSLDAALVGFLVARAGATLAAFVGDDVPWRRRTASESGGDALRNRLMARTFWATIVVLAVATCGLALVGYLRAPGPATHVAGEETREPRPIEIPATVVERLVREAASEARGSVERGIDAAVDAAYAPAYAAVPRYADFHYSVLGEYTELAHAAIGRMGETMQEVLFDGLESRLSQEAVALDARYETEFAASLGARLEARRPPDLPWGPLTDAAVRDALDRAKVTLPLATVAATAAGAGALKATTAAMAQTMAGKIAAKAATKAAAKGGGALAGAGTGAALCSWSGPGAVLCAAAGGAVAWFGIDAAVIHLDEYFNRDVFEAELRGLIDQDKADKRARLAAALAEKEQAMHDFTLRDLGE